MSGTPRRPGRRGSGAGPCPGRPGGMRFVAHRPLPESGRRIGAGLGRSGARSVSKASSTKSARAKPGAFRPTIRRENASTTKATRTKPCPVEAWAKSATREAFARSAANWRFARSRRRGTPLSLTAISADLPPTAPRRSSCLASRSGVRRATPRFEECFNIERAKIGVVSSRQRFRCPLFPNRRRRSPKPAAGRALAASAASVDRMACRMLIPGYPDKRRRVGVDERRPAPPDARSEAAARNREDAT